NVTGPPDAFIRKPPIGAPRGKLASALKIAAATEPFEFLTPLMVTVRSAALAADVSMSSADVIPANFNIVFSVCATRRQCASCIEFPSWYYYVLTPQIWSTRKYQSSDGTGGARIARNFVTIRRIPAHGAARRSTACRG